LSKFKDQKKEREVQFQNRENQANIHFSFTQMKPGQFYERERKSSLLLRRTATITIMFVNVWSLTIVGSGTDIISRAVTGYCFNVWTAEGAAGAGSQALRECKGELAAECPAGLAFSGPAMAEVAQKQ
jgi:hypothetical protein